MKLKFCTFLIFGFLIQWAYQIGVSVSCSVKSMDLNFSFDDPFYGKIMMRPNQSCTAKGRGHARLKLTISLDEETRNRCSIVKHGSEYIGAVDIQMHESLRMQEDISYLIRCPINNPEEIAAIKTSTTKEKTNGSLAKLKIFDKKKNVSTKMATVGKQYDMHLVVPYQKEIAENVKVGQCIAFTGEEELKLVQLTDNEGCPLLKEVAHEFRQEYNVVTGELPKNLSYKTSIEMFNLGNASHFFLQCQLQKCHGICLKANCTKSIKTLQNNKKLLDAIDRQSLLTSMRIDVSKGGIAKKENLLCKTSTTEKVIISILIALLAILTSVCWIFAIYKNRKNFNRKIFKDLKTFPSVLNEFKQQLSYYRERVTTFLSFSTSCQVSRSHSFTSNYSKTVTKTAVTNINNKLENNMPTKLDISLPIFPVIPMPPVRTSLLNFSSDTLMPLNDDKFINKNKIIFDEGSSIAFEDLANLDAFPEPPSISLDEIQQLNNAFNNIYSPSDDEIKKDLSQESSVVAIEEFNDASSTLDRPILKKVGIKRTETLDVDNEKKPSLPCTSPPALSVTSNENPIVFPYPATTDKLKVDPIRLFESLKLINNQQQKTSTLSTSKSTIERPRSTGSPYQLFSVYKK